MDVNEAIVKTLEHVGVDHEVLDGHVLGSGDGKDAQPLLAVEDDFAVGVVVADGDVVRLGKLHRPAEKVPGGAGSRGVVRIIQI